MAVSTKLIKGRIKSISNTKKITKAMELVSGAKMRKAVNSVLSTRPYSAMSWDMVVELAKRTDPNDHPLLRISEKKENILLIALFSDRGLCGGFNSQLLRKLRIFENLHSTKVAKVDVIAVGKKGINAFRRSGMNIIAAFEGISNNTKWSEIRPIAKMAINEFISEKYDQVIIGYTDFRSTIVQNPRTRILLPVNPGIIADELGAIGISEPKKEFPAQWEKYEFQFEPNANDVLEEMLPRLVETQVFQAVLESSASEQSARMMAMRSASDAARDMINDLQLTFNQARQASITNEVAEITSGKAALE